MTSEEIRNRERLWRPAAAGLAALGGLVTIRTFAGCRFSEMVRFQIFGSEPPVWGLLLGILAALCLLRLKLSRRDLTLALLPLLLNVPLQFFPVALPSVIVYVFSISWSVVRLGAVGVFAPLTGAVNWNRVLPWGLLAVTLGFAAQGVIASELAWRGMWLTASDWLSYVECCRNTWNGAFMISDWPVRGFSAGHFMPSFILLFAPLFGLFPSPHVAFALNAVILFGSAGLVYFCARRYRLRPGTAAAVGLLYLLYPSISNLNLCLFYGFNALYLFIPFFILYYWCFSTRKYGWAVAIMIFLLLIKETVGVFFAGWGVVLFFGRRRKFGLFTALFGAAYFLVVQRYVIPACSGGEYLFYNQFEALGDSIPEILISPLTRPEAFWGQLLTLKNLLFLLLLLLPIFPAGWGRPGLWLAGAGVLVFNCLRGSAEIVNISQQYQTENVIYFTMLALYGIKDPPRRWLRVLCAPGPVPGRARSRRLMIVGTLVSAGLLHYFCAQTFYGANSLSRFRDLVDVRPVIEELHQVLPAGAVVRTTERSAAQLALRNRMSRNLLPETEYVFYDLTDGLANNSELHREMLGSKDFQLIWMRQTGPHNFYLFQRGAEPRRMPELRQLSEAEFQRLGQPLALHEGAELAEARVALRRFPDGRTGLVLAVRRTGSGDRFLLLNLFLTAGGKSVGYAIPFGLGLQLPEQHPPDGVFVLELPLAQAPEAVYLAAFEL